MDTIKDSLIRLVRKLTPFDYHELYEKLKHYPHEETTDGYAWDIGTWDDQMIHNLHQEIQDRIRRIEDVQSLEQERNSVIGTLAASNSISQDPLMTNTFRRPFRSTYIHDEGRSVAFLTRKPRPPPRQPKPEYSPPEHIPKLRNKKEKKGPIFKKPKRKRKGKNTKEDSFLPPDDPTILPPSIYSPERSSLSSAASSFSSSFSVSPASSPSSSFSSMDGLF